MSIWTRITTTPPALRLRKSGPPWLEWYKVCPSNRHGITAAWQPAWRFGAIKLTVRTGKSARAADEYARGNLRLSYSVA
jgi:hypothetical protein